MKNNINTIPHRLGRNALAAFGATAIAVAGFAQSEEEDVFELPMFQVAGGDDGYRSSNTNSVNLVSTPLKETPVSIEVLNGEVLRDLAVDDINAVIDFATNAGNNQGEAGLQRNLNFRGLTTRFMRRNNFIWYTKSDNFSTDRVEVVRGPAALLYGEGEPGGLVNITSKNANAQSNFGEIALTLGTEGQRRGTFDSNMAIIDSMLGIRIAGVKEDSDGWQTNTHLDKEGIFGNILFQPIKGLFLTAEAEIMDTSHQHASIIPMSQAPGVAWTQPITDLGWIGNPQVAGGSINYDNMTSFQSNFGIRDQKWDNYMFKAEWSPIENFSIEAAYNKLHQESIEHRFNGGVVAYGPDEGGNPTGEHAIGWNHPERFNSHNNLRTKRVVATYNIEMGESSHRITAGYSEEKDEFWGRSERPYDADSNGYLGAPNDGWHALSDGPVDFSFADIDMNKYSWENDYWGVGWQKLSPDGNTAVGFWDWRPSSNFGGEWTWVTPDNVPNSWYSPINDQSTKEAKYASVSSKLLDGRLNTLIGYREDDYFKNDIRRGNNLIDEGTADSINAGFTYQVTNQANVYFNYSETFKAAGSFRRDPYNALLTPATGEGIEGGLKYDLNNGWSGIATVFSTDFIDDAVQMGGVDRDIIDPSGLNGSNGSNWVQANTKSQGLEIQAVGSPMEHLTVSLGFAYTDATVASDSSYQIMFNDAFMADANGNPVDQDGNPLMLDGEVVTKEDITVDAYGSITNDGELGLVGTGERGLFVNQLTGQPTGFWNAVNGGERTSPYAGISFNAWGRYNFTEGALKNWFVGGSVRNAMKNYAGYTGSIAAGDRTLHERPSYTLFGIFGGFEKEYEAFTFRAQLNVDNVFDKEVQHGFINARWLEAPRRAKITTTFSF